MAQRAADVVRLLGDLKKLVVLTSQNGEKMDVVTNGVTGDDHRPPKRPWEEISKEPDVRDSNSSFVHSDCLDRRRARRNLQRVRKGPAS